MPRGSLLLEIEKPSEVAGTKALSSTAPTPSPSACYGGQGCSNGTMGAGRLPEFSWQLLVCVIILVVFVLLCCVLAACHRRLRPMVSSTSAPAPPTADQGTKVDPPPLVAVTGVLVLQPDDHQDLAIYTSENAEKEAPGKPMVVDLEASSNAAMQPPRAAVEGSMTVPPC